MMKYNYDRILIDMYKIIIEVTITVLLLYFKACYNHNYNDKLYIKQVYKYTYKTFVGLYK